MQSTKTFTRKYFQKLPLGFLLLLALFAGTLLLFGWIMHEVVWEKEEAIDLSIFDFLSSHLINPRLTAVMKGVTYFASASFLQVAYGMLVLFYFVKKNLKRGMEILFIGIGGFLINYGMKLSFHRPRPPHPLIDPLQNFSFPSGHATSGFIFYGLLAYLVWKTELSRTGKILAGSLLILFSLLIGFSRIYLRMHYTSDVLAGFCIGFAWLLLAVWFLERSKKKSDAEIQAGAG